MANLIREVYQTLLWRYPDHAENDEMWSLLRVVTEGDAHVERVRLVSAADRASRGRGRPVHDVIGEIGQGDAPSAG